MARRARSSTPRTRSRFRAASCRGRSATTPTAAWKICDYADGGPYAFATGQRILSEAEFAPVSSALHGLRRATKTACGADKPSETIVFTTPAGDTTYYDDFYFCDAKDTKAYVTGLGNVLAELSKLAK